MAWKKIAGTDTQSQPVFLTYFSGTFLCCAKRVALSCIQGCSPQCPLSFHPGTFLIYVVRLCTVPPLLWKAGLIGKTAGEKIMSIFGFCSQSVLPFSRFAWWRFQVTSATHILERRRADHLPTLTLTLASADIVFQTHSTYDFSLPTVARLIIKSHWAKKTSGCRGTQGSRWPACGPNKNLREQLSSCG